MNHLIGTVRHLLSAIAGAEDREAPSPLVVIDVAPAPDELDPADDEGDDTLWWPLAAAPLTGADTRRVPRTPTAAEHRALLHLMRSGHLELGRRPRRLRYDGALWDALPVVTTPAGRVQLRRLGGHTPAREVRAR
ncbi:hypothetical protein GCM10012275_64290 [Longimycelium tulufanense]|uniref:Uncharacterized protein n=1 Tax=Longimycelium tulufanense TaxID=907463 RepID=A0A8J3CLS5_9PSEU|nr:hypothetical protein [Longimycelium tulufanense]GGM84704.1 hypothetical protein GCM10012275_64290 [Longimycelium tulufanense]